MLISCGLLFISLIFLLNLMTQTGTTSARHGAANGAAPDASPGRWTAPADGPQKTAQANGSAPVPKPSVQTTAAAQTGAAASASPTANTRETEKQASQPPLAPPAVNETKSPAALAPNPANAQSEDGFTLQVGSYSALAQAQERVSKLGSVGVTAYVARVELPKRGTWYRVHAGHFSSREEAVRFGTQLRSRGAVADFIVTPSKPA